MSIRDSFMNQRKEKERIRRYIKKQKADAMKASNETNTEQISSGDELSNSQSGKKELEIIPVNVNDLYDAFKIRSHGSVENAAKYVKSMQSKRRKSFS